MSFLHLATLEASSYLTSTIEPGQHCPLGESVPQTTTGRGCVIKSLVGQLNATL
jgi:hypothetical protein